jgi:hypothetical protein
VRTIKGRRNQRLTQSPILTEYNFEIDQRSYDVNKPLFGNAFCPLVDRNRASARLSSFSPKLGGL